MKILLLAVNAKYIHTNPAVYSLRQYAAGTAGEDSALYAERILLREYTINHEPDVILRGIYELRPQVLCISCYIWNIRMVREIVADYKKLDAKVHIYLGGPEVSYDAEECLVRMPEVSGVMVGEGEATFAELVRYYFGEVSRAGKTADMDIRLASDGFSGTDIGGSEKSVSPQDAAEADCLGIARTVENDVLAFPETSDPRANIRGLAYRAANGSIHINPPREPLDFSALPFPYADIGSFAGFEHKIIYYETSRGCPFSCCYCLSSVEKSLRLRELSLVDRELQIFLDSRVSQVKFVDRTFNCNKAHAMHIWRYIHEHDNGVTNFHFEIAADLLDDEQVALLSRMRPGLIQLEIGVQSTNPRTVAAIHRRMDLEKVAARVAQVRRARNIHQHLDLIAGLPYEDYASFAKSFDEVYRMGPDQLQLGFLKVLKGSAMADMAGEHGVLFKTEPPYEVLSTKYLPYADLLRLKDVEEMVEVYYNSGQFLCTIPYLKAHFAGPFALFEALGVYYRKAGLFDRKHGRMERYEILYRFAAGYFAGEGSVAERAAEIFGENEIRQENIPDAVMVKKDDFLACLAECLCFDLYSRERPKVQPYFARMQEYEKQELRGLLTGFGVGKERAGQCYVAHFCYDMGEAAGGRTKHGGMDCLFDYTSRDPLSGVCAVDVKGAGNMPEGFRFGISGSSRGI